MYKQATRLLAGLLLGAAPIWATAGISSIPQNPGFGEPSYSQAEYDQNYGAGRTTGRIESAAECIANPANCGCVDQLNPCGISLSSVLSGARFGETEPNDHPVAADGIITEVVYWGQTPWLQDKVGEWHRDQDWFYVTTQEPNQLLTVNFTVPDRVLLDNTRLSQGWMISVRDAAGNVYAQFDTRFALDDLTTPNKNESKEIAYPIFLGHVGTYYVSIEPRVAPGGVLVTNPVGINADDLSVTYSPYNIAFVLEFSGMEGVPPDVNFHDVEIEPNDDRAHANPLASGVTMYGQLRQTYDDVFPVSSEGEDSTGFIYDQTQRDFFRYRSPGNEQVSLAWCGREECRSYCSFDENTGFTGSGEECDGNTLVFWFVEVTGPDGAPLASITTNKSETLKLGLDEPGDYFVEVGFNRNHQAYCRRYSETEFECKGTSFQCQELTVTENPGSGAQGPFLECDYGPGTTCGPAGDSGVDIECALVSTGDSVFSGGDCAGDGSVGPETCTGTCECPVGGGPATCSDNSGTCPDPVVGGVPSPPNTDFHRSWRWAEVCEEYGPVCEEYAPRTEIGAISVQYNFTWWGTKLVPLTNGTEAYGAYLERPSWYQDR